MADKVMDALLEALKKAMVEPAEQPLFRSGKLAGLFAGRSGANGEAASRAIQEGLLEVVRSETKGKTAVDWVRTTPRAVHFVHEYESPLRALQHLRELLQVSRDGIPVWLAEMRRNLQGLATRLAEESQRWTRRLEMLSQHVEEALRRSDAGEKQTKDGQAIGVPWAKDALAYIDRRQRGGAVGQCALPELFAALRLQYTDLSMTHFHDGLRRLHENKALHLFPFRGPPTELPQPEYALLDGASVFYYATR
jgi:hypothetical protein